MLGRKVLLSIVAALFFAAPLMADQSFGAINGNVPDVQYDNANRVYTQIVVPPNRGNEVFAQRVVGAFSNDPVIRQNSIVRMNANDENFKYRWGNAFGEADQGYPTVGVVQERYGTRQCVYKMPLANDDDIQRELGRCGQVAYSLALNQDCPTCPKPRTPTTPSPVGPAQPNQPLGPLPNTPPGSAPGDQMDPGTMMLAAGAGLFIGWFVMFKRGS